MIKIAPSILSANFACLLPDIEDVRMAGADYLHIDVMDGVFVNNISIGVPVVRSIRNATDMTLDVHLMIDRPHRYAVEFCRAGADIVVFHVEADQPQNLLDALTAVKSEGKKAGLAIKPRTPAATLIPYLERLDLVLVMTVEPGFGGQSFMADQLQKIRKISDMINDIAPNCELEVDGGIDRFTAAQVVSAGANVLVAGSAIFGKPDRTSAINALRVQN